MERRNNTLRHRMSCSVGQTFSFPRIRYRSSAVHQVVSCSVEYGSITSHLTTLTRCTATHTATPTMSTDTPQVAANSNVRKKAREGHERIRTNRPSRILY